MLYEVITAILEEVMLDVMYEIPMRDNVSRCTITREMVEHGLHPLEGLTLRDKSDEKKKSA